MLLGDIFHPFCIDATILININIYNYLDNKLIVSMHLSFILKICKSHRKNNK